MSTSSAAPSARLRRSILSVPAINKRALEKSLSLDCDGIIFDLEDSVAIDMKDEARDNLRQLFEHKDLNGREAIIRVNGSNTRFITADLELVRACRPDAVLLPKTEQPDELTALRHNVDADVRLWAMIETPKAILNASHLAAKAAEVGLACLVVGLNDLRKETRVPAEPGRHFLIPWLMQVVLAARAYGLDVIDSVSNDFKDLAVFAAECGQGAAMGFDGKMLIHPAQITAANSHFGPSDAEIADARALVAAFAAPEAAHLNIINQNGRMIERLHAEQAERLLSKLSLLDHRKV
ncbi:HpcH/HpaI aldolase/citrate lyase family protein [Rhizobium oryziradicis]|uniref:ATP-binding protein n=1 Tax=Rhizobium oryziradicis TaxID=1867956 RepID=A0A1Q8ZL75_9HYPH|nr:CoA ester lyase [Rhizobium oryziradicis]OLP42639.1 ATP-binding protein [Rhizobium oryziradicis]